MILLRFSQKPKKSNHIRWWPFVLRRVVGHSMLPILPPGTNVIATRWFRKLQSGSVIIFEHNGKEKIKRVDHTTPAGDLYVKGEHPETSTDSRHFGAIDRSKVVGKVIWPDVKPRSQGS